MNLDDIIVAKIPPALLERVVFDQGVLDEQQRAELFKASGLSAQEIARRVVEAYGAQAPRLAYGLYEQVGHNDYTAGILLLKHLPAPEKFAAHNLQASLVGRIPTLRLLELSEFLGAVKSQVCLIVSRNGRAPAVRGTGFLVGPNLVLTCRHVLKAFPDTCEDVRADGRRIELFFDFHEGDPVENVGPNLPRARKVGLAPKWRLGGCDSTEPDGVPDPLDAENEQRIKKALDFVLLQLDEPLGLQPVDRGGGRRRGWVDLPAEVTLTEDDWIIIPQHPEGFPQRIDLGRFKKRDQTETRIRYDTNTAKGTSGAPCFNHRFELVGLHNAYVGPPENPLFNQAISFDRIMARIGEQVNQSIINAEADPYVLHWSVARPNEEPRVILGRQKLLEWLRDSASPGILAERVYVAQAKKGGAGCSFSVDVLDAATRDGKAPRAVYGGKGQQLPATAEDFLISLLRELGIERNQWEADGNALPPRPEAPAASQPLLGPNSEIDKLERWLSEALPDWLGTVITRHSERLIDLREVAQEVVKSYQARGAKPPPEEVERAESPEPVYVRPQSAWDRAYVVIDNLRTGEYQGGAGQLDLKGEVYRLIAAVVKGKPEAVMDPGLKRLRWLFLGSLPDFIAANPGDGNGATTEVLDPDKVGVDEVIAVFDRISKSHLRTDPGYKAMMRSTAKLIVQLADKGGSSTWLARLQQATNRVTADILAEPG
jgi:hypothetical protein